jgi:hypothetical protein
MSGNAAFSHKTLENDHQKIIPLPPQMSGQISLSPKFLAVA